ncbi:MAG: type VI secretion system baseplate subunit TssG [Gemmatimonadota bacterium]|nr:type VI secretion system baseplate subunit TssG [Gemmatimonadota bacterium]MDH4351330.1 type VI secretion system baseplate subunit TssG [Gemmatimonadota bacterium]MDH5197283.1 type VI secretion system baseplate subunit TssG [Gemmatimonadota bacterium]
MTADPRKALAHDATAYQFFQAVRLLGRRSPDTHPVGDFANPADEAVRFSVAASLAFPASEIQAVEQLPDGPPRMTVNFMGLTGPQGVLPYHYTQLVAGRLRQRDRGLRDFLDIFHHRILSLFYRSWEKSHFPVAYERSGGDPITQHVRDLVGMGEPPAEEPAWHRSALLYFAGLLLPQPRSAHGLERLLEGVFDVPVEVEQFVGEWYRPVGETQCVVTDDERVAGRLGQGALVGDAVWDRQAKVRLRLGPLSRERYEEFLPGGAAHEELRQLTRFFGGEALDFGVQLVLARNHVPPCVLGADDGEGLPLGWSTWVRTGPMTHDPDDTILTL